MINSPRLSIITALIGRIGRCTRARPPGARIRPLWEPTSGFCAGTGLAA